MQIARPQAETWTFESIINGLEVLDPDDKAVQDGAQQKSQEEEEE